MENNSYDLEILVGEIVTLAVDDISTSDAMKKSLDIIAETIKDPDGEKCRVIKCVYDGSHNGTEIYLHPMAKENGELVPCEAMRLVLDNPMPLLRFNGILHGIPESLPESIIFTSLEGIEVELHRPKPQPKFIKNIETNIAALVKKYKSGDADNTILIYGPSGTGKSTLAKRIMGELEIPFVSISPRWNMIEFDVMMSVFIKTVEICNSRGIGIILDDVDETLSQQQVTLMPPQQQGQAQEQHNIINQNAVQANALYNTMLEELENFESTMIFASSGKADIDHIINKVDTLFILGFDIKDRVEMWNILSENCTTELANEIATEGLSVALMSSLFKQAKVIAAAKRRKVPNKQDVKDALRCFGQRDDDKAGFGR